MDETHKVDAGTIQPPLSPPLQSASHGGSSYSPSVRLRRIPSYIPMYIVLKKWTESFVYAATFLYAGQVHYFIAVNIYCSTRLSLTHTHSHQAKRSEINLTCMRLLPRLLFYPAWCLVKYALSKFERALYYFPDFLSVRTDAPMITMHHAWFILR